MLKAIPGCYLLWFRQSVYYMYFCEHLMNKKAIIAGASGLIGSNLLQILLAENYYNEVLAVVRKELTVKHKKLKQLIINFDQLDNYIEQLTGDAIFSCLGTTYAQTPDKNEYYKVDHDYPVKLAQIGLKTGVRQLHLVSSIGANVVSSSFYLKLKGETEQDIAKVGLASIYIYQPSMLKGRQEKMRFLEKLFNGITSIVDPLLLGGLKKYHSVSGALVARAMYNQSIDNEAGVFIHQYNEIKKLK